MMRNAFLLFAGLTMVTACGRSEPAEPEAELARRTDSALPSPRGVHVALSPTVGHSASGMLMLNETDDGVKIEGRIIGLRPDVELGFHVHEIGDCSAPDASSAGEHFNPTNQPHGDPRGDAHHLGDMVNLDVDDNGEAQVDLTLEGLTLTGMAERSLRDRAIVVHAMRDDYKTQPAGGSGDRVACGVIETDPAALPVGAGTPPPAPGTVP